MCPTDSRQPTVASEWSRADIGIRRLAEVGHPIMRAAPIRAASSDASVQPADAAGGPGHRLAGSWRQGLERPMVGSNGVQSITPMACSACAPVVRGGAAMPSFERFTADAAGCDFRPGSCACRPVLRLGVMPWTQGPDRTALAPPVKVCGAWPANGPVRRQMPCDRSA